MEIRSTLGVTSESIVAAGAEGPSVIGRIAFMGRLNFSPTSRCLSFRLSTSWRASCR